MEWRISFPLSVLPHAPTPQETPPAEEVGDGQEFTSLLNFVPDGEAASVCIRSTHPQAPGIFECCGPTGT